MRELLSTLWRTLILLGAAGIIIAVVYLPVRWSGISEMSARREAIRREAFRNIPPGFPERLIRERPRVPPMAARFRMVTTHFVVITIAAWIGRKVFRLRLKR